jgi:hypothetical protein
MAPLDDDGWSDPEQVEEYLERVARLDARPALQELVAVDRSAPMLARAAQRAEDDPADRLADVHTQLGWMRAAGLVQVDCLWRWRGFAVLVGAAPN